MLSKSKEIVWRFPLGLFLLSFSSSNFCAEKTNFFHRETFDSLSLSLSFAHCVKKFFLVQKLNLDFQSLKYLKLTQKSHKNFFLSSYAWKLIKTGIFWKIGKIEFFEKIVFLVQCVFLAPSSHPPHAQNPKVFQKIWKLPFSFLDRKVVRAKRDQHTNWRKPFFLKNSNIFAKIKTGFN